jgi:hypothetical protein
MTVPKTRGIIHAEKERRHSRMIDKVIGGIGRGTTLAGYVKKRHGGFKWKN